MPGLILLLCFNVLDWCEWIDSVLFILADWVSFEYLVEFLVRVDIQKNRIALKAACGHDARFALTVKPHPVIDAPLSVNIVIGLLRVNHQELCHSISTVPSRNLSFTWGSIIYDGESATVIASLETALGPQFAGG